MLIHDSFSSVGVTVAIVRELMFGQRWRYLGRSRSLAEYRADLDGTVRSRGGNAGRQMLQLPWFIRNLVIKAALTLKLGRVLKNVTGNDLAWPY